MVSGLGAALVIYRLFRLRASHRTALWATVFVATFPVSPVLQVPYAESLNLLLLAAALLLVVGRRYLWAIPVVVLMCLSRPTGVPFAATVGCCSFTGCGRPTPQAGDRRAGGPRRPGSPAALACAAQRSRSGRWRG